MSSKSERRVARQREWDVESEKFRAEDRRKAALDMFSRIEESDASDDVKTILHKLAQHVGLES